MAPLAQGRGGWPGEGERNGFALPLALVVALLLLLSSLAMQTMILQVRSRRAVVLELRQAEDRLASAAHQLVGRLRERHPCLFGLNLAAWSVAGLSCGDSAEILGLIEAEAHGLAWTVIDWRPLPGGRQVDLLLQVPDPSGRAPRRGQFRVELEPTASLPRVLALRAQGLRGIPAAEL
ncbi:MAG: hypothetical protein VKI42_01365 [Synechococcaceae cyanobacterium]|nr:hypothetical protein [Synechococcaceae cyanobacterium]